MNADEFLDSIHKEFGDVIIKDAPVKLVIYSRPGVFRKYGVHEVSLGADGTLNIVAAKGEGP